MIDLLQKLNIATEYTDMKIDISKVEEINDSNKLVTSLQNRNGFNKNVILLGTYKPKKGDIGITFYAGKYKYPYFIPQFNGVEQINSGSDNSGTVVKNIQAKGNDKILADRLIKTVIEIGKSKLNIVESPLGSDRGKEVDEIESIGSNGTAIGYEWCQYFQNYLLIKACQKEIAPYRMTYSGYCPDVVDYGSKQNIVIENPSINDVAIGDWGYVYGNKVRYQHVYLITGKEGNSVKTLEGNTSSSGVRHGIFEHVRPIGNQVKAIVRWSKMYG